MVAETASVVRILVPPPVKDDGGGTPLDVSGIEENPRGSKHAAILVSWRPTNAVSQRRLGDTGREGSDKLPLDGSEPATTISDFEGPIPRSPSHALTALSMASSLPCAVELGLEDLAQTERHTATVDHKTVAPRFSGFI